MRALLRPTSFLIALLLLAGCSSAPKESAPESAPKAAPQASGDMILATTTSTQDSGLLDVLIPVFEKESGVHVKVVAVGTGKALAMGEGGEADALLVHAPASEKPLVDAGVMVNYHQVMHNDFVLVGPESDPAKIGEVKTAADALKRIANSKATFVSRGDDSGTHKKEKSLWTEAGVKAEGEWYLQSGTGMGQTLAIASEKEGYTLTDRATYLAQQKNLHLSILVEGDGSLLNIYHVGQVNPEKFDKVNGPAGKAFVEFMLSAKTQDMIAKFGVEKYGQPLFFADAGK